MHTSEVKLYPRITSARGFNLRSIVLFFNCSDDEQRYYIYMYIYVKIFRLICRLRICTSVIKHKDGVLRNINSRPLKSCVLSRNSRKIENKRFLLNLLPHCIFSVYIRHHVLHCKQLIRMQYTMYRMEELD